MIEEGQPCLRERKMTSYFWIAALLYIYFPKSAGDVMTSATSV